MNFASRVRGVPSYTMTASPRLLSCMGHEELHIPPQERDEDVTPDNNPVRENLMHVKDQG